MSYIDYHFDYNEKIKKRQLEIEEKIIEIKNICYSDFLIIQDRPTNRFELMEIE
jgi:hypothetical protein